MAKLDLDGLWSPSELIKWEKKLREDSKGWKAAKVKWKERFDHRMDKLTEWETNTLKREREVSEREGMLAGREDLLA